MSPTRHALFTPEGGLAIPEFRIGLAPVPNEAWLEGQTADPAPRKDALLEAHPALVWGEVEGSRPAQAELAAMVAGAVGGLLSPDHPPLRAAARLVEDDLCLMQRRDGDWTLIAASLCSPSFFSADQVVGKPLAGLHAPVPGFNESLLPRVGRIFDNLPPDQVVERRNWTVVNDPEPFQPDPAPFRARLPGQNLDQIGDSLQVRRERQTLRRAPGTDAILFTIRIWTEPLDALLADPDRRAAFAAAWDQLTSEAGAPFRTYKRLDLYDAAVRRRLERG